MSVNALCEVPRFARNDTQYLNARLSRAHSPRPSAVRPASRARTFPRRRLALRGDHRDLHSAAAHDAAAGARRRAVQTHDVDHADALRHVAGRTVARALRATPRSVDRSRRARTRAKPGPSNNCASSLSSISNSSRRAAVSFVDEWKCDLLSAFRELREAGALEIIASAATHGLLPILQQQSPEAARAQVLIGRDVYRRSFRRRADRILAAGMRLRAWARSDPAGSKTRWFILDAHGLMFGQPRPRASIYAPCYTPAGPAAFARDRESSRQVWSANGGYPGDPAYREFYRDVGFDLPSEHLGPVARGSQKILRHEISPHHRARRRERSYMIARRRKKRRRRTRIIFSSSAGSKFAKSATLDFDPIVVATIRCRIIWSLVVRRAAFSRTFHSPRLRANRIFSSTTPSEYLATHPTQQTIEPAASTWGENGYLRVWLDPKQLVDLSASARCGAKDDRNGTRRFYCCRATPKAFGVAERGSGRRSACPTPYRSRFETTRPRTFARAVERLGIPHERPGPRANTPPTARWIILLASTDCTISSSQKMWMKNFLRECEWRDNLFPNVNWRYYV